MTAKQAAIAAGKNLLRLSGNLTTPSTLSISDFRSADLFFPVAVPADFPA